MSQDRENGNFRSDHIDERGDANDEQNDSVSSEKREILRKLDERPSSPVPSSGASTTYHHPSVGSSCSGSIGPGSSSCSLSFYDNTEEPDIEKSLAYTNNRNTKAVVKRTKQTLPPGEVNVVDEPTALTESVSGMFRNKFLGAALSHAEKERQMLHSQTPESIMTVVSNSALISGNTDADNENLEKLQDLDEKMSPEMNSGSSTINSALLFSVKDKTSLSETDLLHEKSMMTKVIDDVQRSNSAPVSFSSTCTQTEWSWIEDMKKHADMKSKEESSQTEFDESIIENEHDFDPSKTSNPNMKIETKNVEDEGTNDMLHKPPLLETSSSSSSDEENDYMANSDKELFLPSIGPPKILQYIKESKNPPFTNEFSDNMSEENFHRHIFHGDHSFFKKIEKLRNGSTKKQTDIEDCVVYEEHMKLQHMYQEEQDYITDEFIDIRPHPPFGTKAARKAAKERAAARAREREADRQKVSGAAVNYYSMTRQMKTLTYSLASSKCMEDGWTLKPSTPVGSPFEDHLEPFEIEINSSRAQKREIFMEKFYQNGNRLLVLFPDGTGCCYYPSGNPAIVISSTEKGKYSYVLLENTHEHSRDNTGVLGVFDPTGHGCCYYQQTAKLRMVLTPFGGTFFDIKEQKKKKWFWYNITRSYVQAPPFQPITFAWTKELSLRCMGQDYIIITYSSGRHTIRFNVGAKLKPIAKKVKLPNDEEQHETQLKEIRKFINVLLEQVQTTIRFPHSHRITKLSIPERPKPKPLPHFDSSAIKTDEKTTVIVN